MAHKDLGKNIWINMNKDLVLRVGKLTQLKIILVPF